MLDSVTCSDLREHTGGQGWILGNSASPGSIRKKVVNASVGKYCCSWRVLCGRTIEQMMFAQAVFKAEFDAK